MKQHNIIADSNNYITECGDFNDFSSKPKFLKPEEFLEAIKTPRHIKQRCICTKLDHINFLKLVKERNLPLLNIKYEVNGEAYSFDLLVCNRTTPRSIDYACYMDYRKRGIEEVTMPYYDDDYDVYSDSNIKLKLIFMKEFYDLPALKGDSKEEIEEMFGV